MTQFTGTSAAAFGYPNEDDAAVYCNSFRLALGSATGFFLMMHLIAIACYRMITQNEHRDSFVHDEIDFDAVARDLDIARQSKDASNSYTANPLSKS
jgi:hypothetical protein